MGDVAVGEVVHVSVVINNMEWSVELPEGIAEGVDTVCELPVVMPMDARTQRAILHQDILSSRLRFLRSSRGAFRMDVDRVQRKVKAYRTLRGRSMGLALTPVLEEDPCVPMASCWLGV